MTALWPKFSVRPEKQGFLAPFDDHLSTVRCGSFSAPQRSRDGKDTRDSTLETQAPPQPSEAGETYTDTVGGSENDYRYSEAHRVVCTPHRGDSRASLGAWLCGLRRRGTPAQAAWAVLVCVIVLSAPVSDRNVAIVKTEPGVAWLPENVAVVDRSNNEYSARDFRFDALFCERRDTPLNREHFFASLAEDSRNFRRVLVADHEIGGSVAERRWQHRTRGNIVISGNNSSEDHVACRCLPRVSEVNCSCGVPFIPVEVAGFDIDISSQLPFCRLVRKFYGGFGGFGRSFSRVSGFFSLDHGFDQGVIGFPKNGGAANSSEEQEKRPSDQPARESVDWYWLIKPPTIVVFSLMLGLLCGLAGFVILFGPHVSPKNYLLRNIGTGLFFAGLLACAISLFAIVQTI